MFQFHKGSIKTTNTGDYSAATNTFQFHKGSIKTQIE